MDITTNYLPDDLQFKIVPFEGDVKYDSMKLHRHDYTEIFIFETGGGTHLIDFEEYEIKAKDIHFVFPNQIHLVKRESKAHGFVVLFKADFLEVSSLNPMQAFSNAYFNNPILKLNEIEFARIKNIFQLLNLEYAQQSEQYSFAMLKYYTNAFLIQCLRYKNTQLDNLSLLDQNHQLCNWFRKEVEQHFKSQINLLEYQQSLGCTYKALSSATKAVLGKSPKELIDHRLNSELRRELLYSSKSLKEVTFEYGFSEASSFTKFFIRMNSQTPQEFKTYWAKKYKP